MTWETCRVSCEDSVIQDIADDTMSGQQIMRCSSMQITLKEMIVSFARKAPEPPSVTMGGKVLERISSAKILGVIVSSDLSWANHVQYICPKASQRVYFLCMLGWAGASSTDMLNFASQRYTCLGWVCLPGLAYWPYSWAEWQCGGCYELKTLSCNKVKDNGRCQK